MKRVIVCDSGLGGLNIARRMCNYSKAHEKCELIYFNAYPDAGMGFNKIKETRKQEELFQVVLESMKKFSPDCCVIACNTLSIIYRKLARWYTPPFPVITIVDAALDAMYGTLSKDEESSLLILGTQTTVNSGFYQEKLIEKGIDRKRIYGTPCPGLATLLESDPASPEVADMIADFASATPEIPGRTIYLAWCCTHFEFAGEVWVKEFGKVFPDKEIRIINPNEYAAGDFAAQKCSYLSRINFFPGAKEAMSRCFAGSKIAEAIEEASADEKLFEFDVKKYF